MKIKHWIIIFLLLGAAAAVAFGVDTSGHGADGEPRHADSAADSPEFPSLESLTDVAIPDGIDSKLLRYTGFDVNFNPKAHQPNYAVWVLTPEHTDGPFSRNDAAFAPDSRVDGCATLADYKNSGFDRGHLAPAADMKWDRRAMADCHYLTNMCPQSNSLNAGAWATVEKNARKWAQLHGPLVIVAGPVLSDRMTRTIGSSKIPVPERFFKVILAPEADPPLGIAFIMPNGYVDGGAQSTVVSIDQVEATTGFDFFSALPDDIETAVESSSSLRAWNR